MKPTLLIAGSILLSVAPVVHSQAGADLAPDLPKTQAPIYFLAGHHQEAVGSSYADFSNFARFKRDLRHEMELLDRYGVVTDQYFSDFIVSVVLYERDSGKDPNAEEVFRAFNQSRQHLGYHFHPTTWTATDPEPVIRLEKIKDLPFNQAVTEYAKWEQAYYDWSGCTSSRGDGSSFCGSLDPNRLGGVRLMEQYFAKPVCAENATLLQAPAGQVLTKEDSIPYTVSIPIVGEDIEIPIQANAAEFLNGMCTLFLRLRQGDTLASMHVMPGYIVPLSNVPTEAARQTGQTKTNLDWTNELQLWTLEPLRLKTAGLL